MANETNLSLIIRAIDKATGPLREITKKIEHSTGPVKKFGKEIHELGEQSGLFKVGEAFKGVGEAAHKVGEKAFELGKELALMALEGGFVLFEFVKHFVEMGDAAKKTADRVGLTVDQFSSLQFAARKAGLSSEEFTGALDKFNKELGLAHHGTGKLYGFLAGASPVLLKQVTAAKSTEEALNLMWKAMEKFKTPADRAAFATQVFGKSMAKMGGLVKGGVEGLEEQRQLFFKLAGSQTNFAEGAEQLDEMLIDLSTAFNGVGASIAHEFFPVVLELTKSVRDFLVANRDGIASWARDTGKAIMEWVNGGGIQRLIDGFKSFIASVQPIVDKLGGWPLVLAGVAAAFMAAPLLGAIAGLVGSFFSLGAALVTLWPTLTLLGPILLPFLPIAAAVAAACIGIALAAKSIYDNWDDLKLIFTDWWREIEDLFAKGWAVVSPIIDKLGGVTSILQNPLGAAFKGSSMAVNALMGTDEPASQRPPIGAARPPPATASAATITVDFNNAPKGTKAKAEGTHAALDLSMGYAGGG
jgi:hypothetical protein